MKGVLEREDVGVVHLLENLRWLAIGAEEREESWVAIALCGRVRRFFFWCNHLLFIDNHPFASVVFYLSLI